MTSEWNAAIEAAAKWHDREALNWRHGGYLRHAKEHSKCAAAIRALPRPTADGSDQDAAGVVVDLRQSLATVGEMIRAHIEKYHDYEAPFGEQNERTALLAIDHHIQGALITDADVVALNRREGNNG